MRRSLSHLTHERPFPKPFGTSGVSDLDCEFCGFWGENFLWEPNVGSFWRLFLYRERLFHFETQVCLLFLYALYTIWYIRVCPLFGAFCYILLIYHKREKNTSTILFKKRPLEYISTQCHRASYGPFKVLSFSFCTLVWLVILVNDIFQFGFSNPWVHVSG